MNPYANTYKTQQIQTASKEQILIMLYEGAIRFLNLAKAGHEEGNIEKFHNNLMKTQRIIMEFMSTLDVKMGGEMAQNLFKLYEYLHYRLIQANLKKDVTMIDEVLEHLRELKATWEEAISMAKPEKMQEINDASGDHVYSA
jgi:flagellar protein FliS